jgi:hypothetical protein
MRTLILIGLALASAIGLRWLARPAVLPVDELAALDTGRELAMALTAPQGTLTERLEAGFALPKAHPQSSALKGEARSRAATTLPPMPRWLVGASILAVPGDTPDTDRAAWGAAIAFGLALATIALTFGWRIGTLAILSLLVLPGAAHAPASVGTAAMACTGISLLLAGIERARRGRGGLCLAVGWAILLGCHPGTFFLVIPCFVGVAICTPRTHPPVASGSLALPAVSPLTLGFPVVAVVLLVLAWPVLWEETAKHLIAWLTEVWRTPAPAQTVAGVAFDQVKGRPPQAWSALAQWAAWTPLPVLGAWLLGLAATLARGREGLWGPLLVLVTLLVVGGTDGGLWGGGMSLAPLTWIPTAITAAVGIDALGTWLARRAGRYEPAILAGSAALILVWPAGEVWTQGAPPGAAAVPLPAGVPIGLLHDVSDAEDRDVLARVQPDTSLLRYGVAVYGRALGLGVSPATTERHHWIVARVDDPRAPRDRAPDRVDRHLGTDYGAWRMR